MLRSFEETYIEKDENRNLWVINAHGNVACEAFYRSEDETDEEMRENGYIPVPYDFEGEDVYVKAVEPANEEE